MQPEIFDVLIVEDESPLARLYADLIRQHPQLRLLGSASTLEEARAFLRQCPPKLVLLDNYLPDGKGISLIEGELLKGLGCSVIFITAASDMDTCSQAIRCGAFDYILKPIAWKRLRQSLERYVQFAIAQSSYKIVDQQNVDSLYQLQAQNFNDANSSKGIEENTLSLIRQFFATQPEQAYSVDEVVENTGLSKTTIRRYLEHSVENGLLCVEMRYGKIGHPRRLYRRT
jgi:two-component system response regulator CitB